MRWFDRSSERQTDTGAQSSSIARHAPWVLAFLLTGCPLEPFSFGSSGGIATTGSITTSLAGCGAPNEMPDECDDDNPCTIDTCEDGVCSYEPASAGTPCPDASSCNGKETCDGKGVCVAGTPEVIDDGDECTVDVCDPKTGEVTHPLSPGCGTWDPTGSAGAPIARQNHTAVWTGTEMIVWGGEVAVADDPAGVTATGGRYDPATQTWTATSTANAPPPRHSHVALWTGSKMLVWGGFGDTDFEVTGGAYDPATDSWTPLATASAPSGRSQHRAVWTGAEMIVFGGFNMIALNTGARYDLANDTWTALPVGPGPRYAHGAVWTGTHMIIWGGNDLFDWHEDGRFFDPATGWTDQTSLTDVPDAREGHVTLWTGTQMIVWGGFDGGVSVNTGGVLDPAAATGGVWSPITVTGAPEGRQKFVSVWTGAQMMVWGGCGNDSCASTNPPLSDGGFWTPGADGGTWLAVPAGKVASARINATAVWTGTQVVVWGGKAGLTGKLLNDGAQSEP